MPKTDRILGYLPLTFRAGPDPSALRAVVDAFGHELQLSENSLAAVMQSHWVDFADRGADDVVDLACIGSLFGLLPRDDESVEEFRRHLKRHVQNFLDGTVTVPGLLRITAAALHLGIDDDPIDGWWTRDDAPMITEVPSGADAAMALFGVDRVRREGVDAGPAIVDGSVDLRDGVDLTSANLLWIERDGGGAVPIDLTTVAPDPADANGIDIATAINDQLGADLASITDGRLRLTSASTGPSAQIVVADGNDDAAPAVLGLAPRTYAGADARHATIVGTADLSTGVDLVSQRYIRLLLDGTRLAEVDLASEAADPTSTTLDEIAQAIDAAIAASIATHDGQFLTLTSPTPGDAGSIAFSTPAAQDATGAVFGEAPTFAVGTDARAATARGSADIGLGVDLTERSSLRLAVDGEPPVTLDVAGADPGSTLPGEIVTSLNTGLGATVASHDGRFLTLQSSVIGAAGLVVLDDVDGDAAEMILGTPPRRYDGSPPATASLTGAVDLTAGVDLSARRHIVVSLDGADPVTIDLHAHARDLRAVTLDELSAAINDAFEIQVATDDGAHLILVSPNDGAGGAVEISPLVEHRTRRFVSRALVTDDAGTRIFGFTSRTAHGSDATSARIVGVNDLLGGIDLRDRTPSDDPTSSWGRHLRIAIDGGTATEVDCAGPRPRATTVDEIVAAINAATGADIASTDGHVVTLVSPTSGSDSSLVLEPTRARDASQPLGLAFGTVRGSEAAGVSFSGLPDLSAGIDLPPLASLAIGVDGAPPVDVVVGDVEAATRTLSQIVGSINVALVGQIASHDQTRLSLTSPTRGAASSIEIAGPTTGTDSTSALLGIGPRSYTGADAQPAVVWGATDLSAADPLGRRVFLQLSIDGNDPMTIDLGSRATNPDAPTPSEIATAINAAQDLADAAIVDARLRLVSRSTGAASRIQVSNASVGDARRAIFGQASDEAAGIAATRAVLAGEVDLLRPVDLEADATVRLAVDGAPPFDVDITGGSPDATVLAEIVAALNRAVPGLAASTADQRLELTSPTAGPDSSVELVPLRQIEIQEYPPDDSTVSAIVGHGTTFVVDNRGAADATASFCLEPSAGTVGPKLASLDHGWSVRVAHAVQVGERLDLQLRDGGIRATIHSGDDVRVVRGEHVLIHGDTEQLFNLARGRNRFAFAECDDARFDDARFGHDRFAGGECVEIGVFDASSFSDAPTTRTAFGAAGHESTSTTVTVSWSEHRAGALLVNLPERLDERYGARFGEGRFGSADAERFSGVVTEPDEDDRHVLGAINTGSGLIEARLAPRVPIGWTAHPMPFRDPAPLTLGSPTREARIFLSEEGFGNRFLELQASHVGTWANGVTVVARQSGPAIYDIEVRYGGGRFENARAVVAGWPPVDGGKPTPKRACQAAVSIDAANSGTAGDGGGMPTLASELGAPGPVGVLVAKAAGVRAEVTRDRARPPDPSA